MNKPIEDYARRYIERFNLALVPIDPGRKFPSANDWGNNVLTDPSIASDYYGNHTDWNMGMALGPSRMCSLDIDCLESFLILFEQFGVDVEAELANVPTIQGSAKGKRVTFRVPDGVSLPYAKLNWPTKADPSKKYTVFELRAATDGRQRQDVLPPSIHPDTKEPYRWLVQPRDNWPEPPAWLLAIWTAWDKFKPQFIDVCPWAEHSEPVAIKTKPRATSTTDKQDSVIDAYTDANPVIDALRQYGYKQIGKRFLSPHSTTKLPGVVPFPSGKSCWIHHASDPLCSEENGQPVNSFDLFSHYEHGGDVSKAVKAAAELLGMKPKPKPRLNKVAQQAREESAPPDLPPELPPEDFEDLHGIDAVDAEPTTPPTSPDTPERSGHFKALGYSGNSYYYLPRATEQVSELKRSGHTSASELMSLAPLEWWESAYPKAKGGVDWQLAGSELMRMCERRGIYNPESVRGRGAWYDDGRAILHLGDRVLVDGSAVRIADHKSRFIYTRQSSTDNDVGTVPADDEQAGEISRIIGQLNWSKPAHAIMCAGWVALAPVCGALPWRPHVWMTAQRGSGKSWVQEHIIYPVIGSAALHVQGGTTEAGIRQRLQQDARPVIFDEAEPDGVAGQKRIQSVIELARQASSDSGAEIVKGTSSGDGMSFRARSMFMMGSVNVGLAQAADESRFTILSIEAPEKSKREIERFDRFSKEVDQIITRELCASIRARIYRMIPTIRKNCKTFARAVAEELGSQRIGDQVGTLLAGYYALESTKEIDLEDARVMARGLDFDEAREAEQVSDEFNCLDRILQAQIRFDTPEGHSHLRAVSEVVMRAAGRGELSGMTPAECNDVLGRFGLKVEGSSLLVSNAHTELQRMLMNTPWGSGWKTILKRLPGAEPGTAGVRFAGVISRHTRIPLTVFLD